MEAAARVLVVEDAAVVARSFRRALRRAGFRVALAGSATGALRALGDSPRLDVVLLDLSPKPAQTSPGPSFTCGD